MEQTSENRQAVWIHPAKFPSLRLLAISYRPCRILCCCRAKTRSETVHRCELLGDQNGHWPNNTMWKGTCWQTCWHACSMLTVEVFKTQTNGRMNRQELFTCVMNSVPYLSWKQNWYLLQKLKIRPRQVICGRALGYVWYKTGKSARSACKKFGFINMNKILSQSSTCFWNHQTSQKLQQQLLLG